MLKYVRLFSLGATICWAMLTAFPANAQYTVTRLSATGSAVWSLNSGTDAWASASVNGTPYSSSGSDNSFDATDPNDALGTIFSLGTEAGADHDSVGSSQIDGSIYVTWRVTGPATSQAYSVTLDLYQTSTINYQQIAITDGDSSRLLSNSPIQAYDWTIYGPRAAVDGSPSTSSHLYKSVTLDATGVGQITVPFAGQGYSLAEGAPIFCIESAYAFGCFTFHVTVAGVQGP